MENSKIPPCTPAASCQPTRCHPPIPPCQNPEKCLQNSIKKGLPKCQSALSLMSSRIATQCGTCARFNGKNVKDPRNQKEILKYLKEKEKEAKMLKQDKETGKNTYAQQRKKKAVGKAQNDCCAGRGHRGRLKKGAGPKRGGGGGGGCTIL